MGAGLARRRGSPVWNPGHWSGRLAILEHSQLALESMFKLLYGEGISVHALRFEHFSEIVTYAALYDLLPVMRRNYDAFS